MARQVLVELEEHCIRGLCAGTLTVSTDVQLAQIAQLLTEVRGSAAKSLAAQIAKVQQGTNSDVSAGELLGLSSLVWTVSASQRALARCDGELETLPEAVLCTSEAPDSTLRELMARIQNPDGQLSERVAEILDDPDASSDLRLRPLWTGLLTDDGLGPVIASRLLSRTGGSLHDLVIDTLNHSENEAAGPLFALARSLRPGSASILEALVCAENPQRAGTALALLGDLAPARAISRALEILDFEPNDPTREFSKEEALRHSALRVLGVGSSDKVLNALLVSIDRHPSRSAQGAIADALARLGHPDTTSSVIERLEPLTRELAHQAEALNVAHGGARRQSWCPNELAPTWELVTMLVWVLQVRNEPASFRFLMSLALTHPLVPLRISAINSLSSLDLEDFLDTFSSVRDSAQTPAAVQEVLQRNVTIRRLKTTRHHR